MRRAYDMEPSNPLAAWYVAFYMALNNNIKEAYSFIDNTRQKNPNNLFSVNMLLLKYSLQKKKMEALGLLTDEIKQFTWDDYILPWYFTDCYALIDEREQSIKWLERAVEWGFINYPYLSEIDPYLENIRGEERFKKLMERVKYEWENFEV